MAGYPLNRNALDQRLGRAVINARDALDELAAIHALLSDTAVLGQAGGSPAPPDPLSQLDQPYTAEEITNIRNGMFAGALLAMLAHGQATLPAASDFFFFLKLLAGASW